MFKLRNLALLLAFGISGGCSKTEVARVPEPWISSPHDEWPQILLTNEARFSGHSGLVGASSFLFQLEDGRILAGTAKHLLGPAGGVEPTIEVASLKRVLQSWRAHPRTEPDSAITLTVPAFALEDSDWLALTVEHGKQDHLPARPLRVRSDPVQVGEVVYLIGCPYSEAACRQKVYAGKVTKREYGTNFRYSIDPPVNYRGFSGGPIVDAGGYLVGVFGIWFEQSLTEGGAEDAAVLLRAVRPPR